mgnify:CR=1 FL=1|jgi:signal transduction histidine kinase/DNA-binding response OmpR family regulator
MSGEQENPASNWFFYFVAAALGVSFLVALLVLAWDNVAEREVQKFAYESLSIDDTVRTNVRAADDAIENISSLLESVPDISAGQLQHYATDVLERFDFIAGIGIYHAGADAGFARFFLAPGAQSVALPPAVGLDAGGVAGRGFTAAMQSSAPIPTGIIGDEPTHKRYLLIKALATKPGAGTTIVALAIDPQAIFGEVGNRAYMTVRLYSESEGVGGRQLLFERNAEPAGDFAIDTLEESAQVRFERYSMRLIAARETYWNDLDKGLLLTALVLGAGITLLLVALARAKDLQARELRERNRVIEDQVARQTRELAEARDQALEASRVKSDFLASMSHEIRTPLNAIIGMAELLSETPLSADQNKYVGVFKNAGEALLSLVNDILDLSKIEAEQLILETIEFDMRELVEQSADLYALKTASKGVELAAHVAREVPPSLVGDPARLRQVILNLIGNAIKFTERGEIVVDVRAAESATEPVMLSFAVSDTGIGIPPEKLESIFGSFTQVDSSTTRKYGGTGLGLTISKKLVEMMGGRIWVESIEGQGSTFRFDIPFARGRTQPSTTRARTVDLHDTRVLVVDDSDINRLILRETLQAEGARITECANGSDAVAEFQRAQSANEPFQLVLCDARMPGMDGFEAIEAMVRQGASIRTVMMLTSSNLGEDLDRARTMGLGAYLVKPVKRGELLRAIGNVIGDSMLAPASAETPLAAATGARKSLLLVEDNPDNRLLIKAYLKREPYDIDEAENGAEALTLFREHAYDLVLMDVQMPVMDGHTATREIRAWEAAQGRTAVPIVALTAHAIKEDTEKSLAAGCTAHLTKPIKKQTLLNAISELLVA